MWTHYVGGITTAPKEGSAKLVQVTILTDSTGSVPLSVWEDQISAI